MDMSRPPIQEEHSSVQPELYLIFIFKHLRIFLRYPIDICIRLYDVSPDISIARLTYRRIRRAELELSVWI
jgi:hypothetical protein